MTGSLSISERLFVIMQRLLPLKLVTRATYRLTRIRQPGIKNWSIRWFVRHFDVDISDADQPVPDGYATFNQFFTRALKSDSRPLADTTTDIIAPCDGTISQIGRIDDGRVLQAKGHDYSLNELLGGDPALADEFSDCIFVTIYLAPYDYHRVHLPLSGTLRRIVHIPGELFSVNASTAKALENLYARNERLVSIIDTDLGPMAVCMVGALNVGSISTPAEGELRCTRKRIFQRDYDDNNSERAGALLGWFNMGSTVIVAVPANRIRWHPELKSESLVRMGQSIGQILND